MHKLSVAMLMAMAWASVGVAADLPGKVSQWKGFKRHDFTVDNRDCIVVEPETTAEGRPWIWRARFFGHEPQLDVALLKQGFHVAYCDVSNLFGSPRAVAHWNEFYRFMTEDQGFSDKPALEGMSRGGLIVYNWAIANPTRVACIYADAPVCDFKTWPGKQGKGKGDSKSWQACLAAYGLTEPEALEYPGNPIDNLEVLAAQNVPLLHVVGDDDDVVPVAENTAIVETRYRALGGPIEVIHKPGVGHHPHSLTDPTRLVDFVLTHTRAGDDLSKSYDTQVLSGWTVNVNRSLQSQNAEATATALKLLKDQLDEIVRVVPAPAVAELQKVSLWMSPQYPNEAPHAAYHPNPKWLANNGRDSRMARSVEFTNVRIFEAETRRMPNFALHELAHAYHHRVLADGFGNAQVKSVYEKAKASGKYDDVERRDAKGQTHRDRAYAMTTPQEYFAETSEAYFSRNDFFPYDQKELASHDPAAFELLTNLWGVTAK
ncbi:prolyl oligopeptidase family serine peptidase [Rubripirellula reticaptiva]|uniref:Alpha/beta hydrolase family protein n=1 Tax=Rubripirellula reticaptiva TaxID=2528013 RepID=A0A5C6ERL7_9BACT|nr:prolyl oligopeptidase family serine peptidase [Rubripirellula reticaptiva]TWU51588.1 Alpha/beta hydrolase family protein [Rubripirellula reticaptiva]